jgi:hypothetical protein
MAAVSKLFSLKQMAILSKILEPEFPPFESM